MRSLLVKIKVPKNFLPRDVNWSVDILNGSLTLSVQNMTLEEAWNWKRPNVGYFRMFRCIAYTHITNKKRKKLDGVGEKCIFLSVSDNYKAYKLYNPNTKRIIISWDVVFDEENLWQWNKKAKQHILVDFDEERDKG